MNRITTLLLSTGVLAARLAVAGPDPTASMPENHLLCLRVDHLTGKFAEQYPLLLPTNPVTGMILDLRFADGDATGAEAALKTFSGSKKPLIVLVNGQTTGGAAEAAQRLRTGKLGLIIGSTNLPGQVFPDIQINAPAADERKYLENPYATAGTTNAAPTTEAKNQLGAFVDHMTEAELVRQRIKDGEDTGDELATPRPAPAQPVIHDPALARAVDLLKALAMLKPARG